MRNLLLCLTLVVAAAPAAVRAQGTPRPTPAAARADTKDLNLRAYVELLRSDVRSQKVAIITELMEFTEAEDKAFWPIYREYDLELSKLNDERVTLIQEYADNYTNVTDVVADKLATKAIELESRRTALKSEVLRALQVLAVGQDGGALSPGREPAPDDHRPADRVFPSYRQVMPVKERAMKSPNAWPAVAVLLLVAGASLSADRVRLRSGKTVDGTFLGGDSKAVRVLLANGTRAEFPIGDVEAMDFTARTPAPPPPDPTRPPAPIMVPGGTLLNVRITDTIDVDASKAGMQFKAIVDDPVMLQGKVVIPRGAAAALEAVKVQQSGTMKGSDKITLKMNRVSFGGRAYDVATQYVETKGKGEGKRTARKVGGGVGLGAVIGGIAGGGEGAAVGALVGGIAGAAVASAGEEHLKIPAETRLQFKLNAAVSIQP